ncbi:MAG: diguanylate cyclase, partial [Actinobacteria bacterium]|nr:diguanylate cyclase [Actinomycetota bacterium]
MLTVFRACAFLAPVLVFLILGTVLPNLVGLSAEQQAGRMFELLFAAAGGAALMGAVAWIAASRRLRGIAAALEGMRSGEAWPGFVERGVAADRQVARALNEAAAALAKVESRARRDRLTGVANRETLMAELTYAIQHSMHAGQPLCIVFVDVDRFKAINDTYGHASGDAVLRQLAELIGGSIRAGDVVGRYGGEEFMIILPNTKTAEAFQLAERVRRVVMATPLRIAANREVRTTVSIGIAAGEGVDLRVDALVSKADAAMYIAKSRGRNQTQAFAELGADASLIAARASEGHHEVASALGQWAGITAIEALASVLAPQPHHRGRPSDMIAAMASGLAARVGLPDAEIDQIRIASLLHDLGKLALPAEILDNPEPLSDADWQTITDHPRFGEMVIEEASRIRDAIPVVLHHHERFNGTGYPDGLEGRAIPLGARIVAIADAYHAMVHDRPYQAARTHEEALAELQRNAGSQFDPELVAAFCDLYR